MEQAVLQIAVFMSALFYCTALILDKQALTRVRDVLQWVSSCAHLLFLEGFRACANIWAQYVSARMTVYATENMQHTQPGVCNAVAGTCFSTESESGASHRLLATLSCNVCYLLLLLWPAFRHQTLSGIILTWKWGGVGSFSILCWSWEHIWGYISPTCRVPYAHVHLSVERTPE